VNSPDAIPLTKPSAPADAASEVVHSVANVSGSWRLATHLERSSYPAFNGLHLGYELLVEQAGNRITGAGRKLTENGSELGPRAQTPITVTGTIDGKRLTLTFTETGTQRVTQERFVLLLEESGALRGRFSSTAAQSSGTVEAHRVQ
jgi:hypothetical protein